MNKKLLIGILIGAVFFALAIRGIDWETFADSFRSVRWDYTLLAAGFTLTGHFLRAYRWQFMMAPIKRVGIHSLWSAVTISFMINNLMPARVGEVARAYAIGRSESISKSSAFATVVYERVIDLLILLAVLWFCLLTVDGPEWMDRAGIALLGVNLVVFVAMFFLVRQRSRVRPIVGRLLAFLPEHASERTIAVVERFVDGLAVMRSWSAVVPIALTSVLVWAAATLGIYYCFDALGMEQPLIAAVLVLVLSMLGSMIPSAPANVGTRQYACILALAIYGAPKSEALAFSALQHATDFFPITILGLFYAWRSQFRVADVTRDTEKIVEGDATRPGGHAP